MPTELERFTKKVAIGPPESCWNWEGATHRNGYGAFRSNGRMVLAHRFAYEYHIAPIPAGAQIHHLCRNRACVNPAHLTTMFPRDHLLIGDAPSGKNARKTHCVRGHPFTEENTYSHVRNGYTVRACRQCRREQNSQWHEDNRERYNARHRERYRKRTSES